MTVDKKTINKQNAASRARYEAKAYDKLMLRLRKDSLSADAVRAAADRAGESVNAYIVGAIRARMEREEDELGADNS